MRTLNLRDPRQHPVDPGERLLRRNIAAVVVRTVDVRVEVRVAHRDVHNLDALDFQVAHQTDGLRPVRHNPVVRLYAEPVRVREPIVRVHPRGNQEFRPARRNRAAHTFAQQTRAVFVAAAVFARPFVRTQQLAQQVPVAALDVRAVEPGALRQLCRRNQVFPNPVERIVGQNPIRRNRVIFLKNRIVVRNQRRWHAVRLAVPPGMRQLAEHQRLVPVFAHTDFLDLADQPRKIVQIVRRHVQLPRIGAPVLLHRRRLEPDHARAALGEPMVPPDGQRVRRPAARAVAPLHRLIRHAVGHGARANSERLRQRAQIVRVRQRAAQLRIGGFQLRLCVNRLNHRKFLLI